MAGVLVPSMELAMSGNISFSVVRFQDIKVMSVSYKYLSIFLRGAR